DRSADGADPRAPGGDGNRRDARYAQRLYGGRPDRHGVRGPHPSGRPGRRGAADRRPRGGAGHRGAAGLKREDAFARGVARDAAAASASLFGEWAATLISRAPPPNDPNVRQALVEAQAAGGGKWPGATLPDIGQLTAQASRIATDIATVSSRIQTAFDSEAVNELRRSIKDFGQIADRLAKVTNEQADVIGSVGSNLRQGSDVLAKAATSLQGTLGRVDSATNQGQLATILNNSAATSANLRSASQDFHDLMGAAHKNQESLVRVLVAADSVLSRISNRNGTLGLLVSDSTLYKETTLTMIQL